MASGSAARLLAQDEPRDLLFAPDQPKVVNINPLTVLIVTPTLQAGAADLGAIDMVRILARSGNRPIVVSRGGRYENDVVDLGAQFIRLDVASKNPLVMLRNAFAIARIARRETSLLDDLAERARGSFSDSPSGFPSML